MLPALVRVEDSTRVAEVRREALAAAAAEGLSEHARHELAIMATEIATNLVKHARAGEVQISRLSPSEPAGVELVSIDRGPGMASVKACTADGYSSTATAGTGMGAIQRLADVFDAFSQPGKGTVLMARKYRDARSEATRWTFAAVRVPYPGEAVCGDAWAVTREGEVTGVLVADGLGHGLLASEASSAAVEGFRGRASASPVAALERLHLALRATRGAAVAVSFIEPRLNRVRFCGLGNIAGVLLGGGKVRSMISHNGTVGMEARRLQEFEYGLVPNNLLVMHSDGLLTNWSLDAYPGLITRHPAVIAGVLYRDACRGRDDACVVVGREMRE